MSIKKIKISDLKSGPIRQTVLPKDFIVRVQKIKEVLKEVETSSLEEIISNFQRDLHPEKELLIWEAIANSYKINTDRNQNWSISQKRTAFKELLGATLS